MNNSSYPPSFCFRLLRFRVNHICLWSILETANSAVSFPLKASANNRYLVDQKNKPFPITGKNCVVHDFSISAGLQILS